MIQKIGIYGGGPLSTDLALLAAQKGISVLLVEKEKEALDQSIETIRKTIDRLVAQEKVLATEKATLIGRIQLSLDVKALGYVEFILVDSKDGEQGILDQFKELDEHVPAKVVMASTSSVLSITKLANFTKNAQRVVGMHFISPVTETKFIEVIRGVQTDREALKKTQELAGQLDLRWVPSHDFPGYLVYRIMAPMINEAVTALYEGIGTAEDIDQAMKWGAKQSLGPLAMADAVGLDKILSVLDNLHRSLANPKFAPCPLLVKYVEAGYLGRRTGKGFYEYKQPPAAEAKAENKNVA